MSKNYTEIKLNEVETGKIIKTDKTDNNIFENIKVYKPTHIKKKIEYNAVLRALKKKDFTTAYMLAKTLRVSPEQVNKWLRTPKAIKIMQEDVNYYVTKIKKSKDWKASAYLLDKVTGVDDVKANASTMIGLNIIVQSK